MIAIELLAQEQVDLYVALHPEKNVGRENTIKKWQDHWNSSTDGRWTYDLIHDINIWLNRKHGELDFYITEMISAHGCFKEYLYRFKIVEDHFCPCCPSEKETEQHVLVRALTILDVHCLLWCKR